jgi:hypothetical protein
MGVLEYHARPLVAFDPNNPEHRQHYATFRKTGSWGRIPVRFIVLKEYQSFVLQHNIEQAMLDYYVNQEFGRAKNSKKKDSSKLSLALAV